MTSFFIRKFKVLLKNINLSKVSYIFLRRIKIYLVSPNANSEAIKTVYTYFIDILKYTKTFFLNFNLGLLNIEKLIDIDVLTNFGNELVILYIY